MLQPTVLKFMKKAAVQLVRKRIKNINLRIDRQGNVTVSAPMKCPLAIIEQFLQKKQNWITRHQTQLRHLDYPATPSLQSGVAYSFLGHSYSLVIREHTVQDRVMLEGNELVCYLKSCETEATTRALLMQWQRQQLQGLLPVLIKKWEAIVGVHADQWRIRGMKTRWGSCNTVKKRICLNLHLMKYPLHCLEYVIVHELVHLLEASHNARFYALMSQFMPEWKQYRRDLRQGSNI